MGAAQGRRGGHIPQLTAPQRGRPSTPVGTVGTSGRGDGPRAAQNPEAESRVHSACGLRQAPCLQSCRPGRLQKPQGPSSRGAAPLTSKNPPPRATERPTQPGSASRSPGPCLGLSLLHFQQATCRLSTPPSPPQHSNARHPRATLNQQRPRTSRGAAVHGTSRGT